VGDLLAVLSPQPSNGKDFCAADELRWQQIFKDHMGVNPASSDAVFSSFAVVFHWQPATGSWQLLLYDDLRFLRKQCFGARVISLL